MLIITTYPNNHYYVDEYMLIITTFPLLTTYVEE